MKHWELFYSIQFFFFSLVHQCSKTQIFTDDSILITYVTIRIRSILFRFFGLNNSIFNLLRISFSLLHKKSLMIHISCMRWFLYINVIKSTFFTQKTLCFQREPFNSVLICFRIVSNGSIIRNRCWNVNDDSADEARARLALRSDL